MASEVPENKTIDFKLWWASNFRWVPDFITDRSYTGFKVTPRFLGEEITQTNDDFDLVDVAFDHFVPSVFVEHYDSFRSFAVGSVPMPALRGGYWIHKLVLP